MQFHTGIDARERKNGKTGVMMLDFRALLPVSTGRQVMHMLLFRILYPIVHIVTIRINERKKPVHIRIARETHIGSLGSPPPPPPTHTRTPYVLSPFSHQLQPASHTHRIVSLEYC